RPPPRSGNSSTSPSTPPARPPGDDRVVRGCRPGTVAATGVPAAGRVAADRVRAPGPVVARGERNHQVLHPGGVDQRRRRRPPRGRRRLRPVGPPGPPTGRSAADLCPTAAAGRAGALPLGDTPEPPGPGHGEERFGRDVRGGGRNEPLPPPRLPGRRGQVRDVGRRRAAPAPGPHTMWDV